jgi:hypothetical protein
LAAGIGLFPATALRAEDGVRPPASSFFDALRAANMVRIEQTLAPEVEFDSDEPTPNAQPETRKNLALILSSLRASSPFDWQSSSCHSPAADQTICDIIFRFRSNGSLSRQTWSVLAKDGLIAKITYSKYELVKHNG